MRGSRRSTWNELERAGAGRASGGRALARAPLSRGVFSSRCSGRGLVMAEVFSADGGSAAGRFFPMWTDDAVIQRQPARARPFGSII